MLFKISLKFVPKVQINNIPALFQTMCNNKPTWRKQVEKIAIKKEYTFEK